MKRCIFISLFILVPVAFTQAEDNYMIGNTLGGAGTLATNWLLGTRNVNDDIIFDATKYFEANPDPESGGWDVTQWVYDGLGEQYVTANSMTLQNLYIPDSLKSIRFVISTPGDDTLASSKILFNITKDFNFVSDSYNSTFIWQTGGSTFKWPINSITIGGDINLGSASSKESDGGTVNFGGYTNTSMVKKMTVGGNINLYGNVKLSLSVGVKNDPADVTNATFKAAGVVYMNKIGNATPTLILNNTSSDADSSGGVLNACVDVGGISGYGTITDNIASLGGSSTLILRNTGRNDFYGTIYDKISIGTGVSTTSILMAGATGVQTFRGEVKIAGTLTVRRGTILINGTKLGNITVGYESGAALGAIGADTEFGVINAKSMNMYSGTKLLFDIDGNNQDQIILSDKFDITGGSVYIEFTSLANINENAEYKLVEYATAGENLTIDRFNGLFLEGYDGDLFIKDNAIWVKFTEVVVPEPQTYAFVAAFAAIALALIRRKK